MATRQLKLPPDVAIGHLLRLIIFFALLGSAQFGWCAMEDDAAAKVRLKLADAFSNKDLRGIELLISDPWSGMRFCAGWTDTSWKEAGTRLREAKWKSSDRDTMLYVVDGKNSEMVIYFSQERGWILDLNSFLGPFPIFR